jgi:hypothetical protein
LSQLFKKTYGIELDLTRSLDSLAEQIQELQIKQQQIHDRDLCAIWPKIHSQLPPTATSAPPPVVEANEIRAWMMESANLPYLASITSLDLENLFLKTIPSEIGQLSQLSYLGLSNNKIAHIPDAIGQLSQLSYLGLSNNKIAHIPDEIGQLSQLSYLGLSNNKIAHIPDAIGKLSQLSSLNLSNNQITSITDEVGQLFLLPLFFFHNNPVLYISKAVLTSDSTKHYETKKTFAEALQWRAQFPLAKLCLAIMQDGKQAMENMPALLSHLFPEERSRIFFHIWDLNKPSKRPDVQWGEQHALDKPELFMCAVHRSIVGYLATLPQKPQNAVYRKIGQLVGRRHAEALWWGKDHATENLPRLADALTWITR